MKSSTKVGVIVALLGIVLLVSLFSYQAPWYVVSEDTTYQNHGNYDLFFGASEDPPEQIRYEFTDDGLRVVRTSLESGSDPGRRVTYETHEYEEKDMPQTAETMEDISLLSYLALFGSILSFMGVILVGVDDQYYKVGVAMAVFGLALALVAPVYFPFQTQEMFEEDNMIQEDDVNSWEKGPQTSFFNGETVEDFGMNSERMWRPGSGWLISFVVAVLNGIVLLCIVRSGTSLGNTQTLAGSSKSNDESESIFGSNVESDDLGFGPDKFGPSGNDSDTFCKRCDGRMERTENGWKCSNCGRKVI